MYTINDHNSKIDFSLHNILDKNLETIEISDFMF